MRPHKDIDITCESGRTMEGQGISPDDLALNLVFVQQREQVSEVGLYFHSVDGGGIRWDCYDPNS